MAIGDMPANYQDVPQVTQLWACYANAITYPLPTRVAAMTKILAGFGLTPSVAPVVDSVAPPNAASGSVFTITGSGFIAGSGLIGTMAAGGANFTIVDSTSITVNLSGAPGAYTVGIGNDNGESNLVPVTIDA